MCTPHGALPENDANQQKRRAILLQAMGVELFNKFCDSAGDNIDALTFDQIVAAVEALVNPAPVEVYERYRFHNCKQADEESVADYTVKLRKIALTCNFVADGANNADPARARLRDQFVCGLKDKAMQQYLLQQPALTVDNCVTLATSFESAAKTTNLMNEGETSSKVVEVKSVKAKARKTTSKRNMRDKGRRCNRCGSSEHLPDDCPFKKEKCYKCGHKGHTKRMCDETEDEEVDSEPIMAKSTKSKAKPKDIGRLNLEQSEDSSLTESSSDDYD